MELDDLRRQWQQPAPSASAALTLAELSALLTRQRGSLVDKMRRNARWEAVGTALLAAATVGFLPFVPELGLLPHLLLLLTFVLLYYYYRVLGALRQMTKITGSVRNHLARLCAGLRQMLRFNYGLTLAMVPITLLVTLGLPMGRELARVGQEILRHQPVHWGRLPLLTGILLGAGGLVRALVIPVTRWQLQRLYGQHLDRLEGQLRELDEPPPGA
ncbi:hypothetical protein ACFQ48_00510 [Hymenobacter caeli]|uniref:Uncharacterized protein n=1 Tax=Hymenobacter caeli TaxID=2735894 RepID=A0ABX2FLB7_9BACT|nr:hypothetical protein [Hymenobacter caeli]NRT17300.1 hypothetical protein [Hymenobacter caeli]